MAVMPSELLDEANLMAWSGHAQRVRLEKWLKEQRIPYRYGKGGRIITTLAAVNAALVAGGATIGPDPIEFE